MARNTSPGRPSLGFCNALLLPRKPRRNPGQIGGALVARLPPSATVLAADRSSVPAIAAARSDRACCASHPISSSIPPPTPPSTEPKTSPLAAVTDWCRSNRHQTIRDQHAHLTMMMRDQRNRLMLLSRCRSRHSGPARLSGRQDLEEMAVASGLSASAPLGSIERSPNASPTASRPDRPSVPINSAECSETADGVARQSKSVKSCPRAGCGKSARPVRSQPRAKLFCEEPEAGNLHIRICEG